MLHHYLSMSDAHMGRKCPLEEEKCFGEGQSGQARHSQSSSGAIAVHTYRPDFSCGASSDKARNADFCCDASFVVMPLLKVLRFCL